MGDTCVHMGDTCVHGGALTFLCSSPVSGFQREGAAAQHLPVHRRRRAAPVHGGDVLASLWLPVVTGCPLKACDGLLQVEELSERGFLPEEEKQSVAFIREMEELGSLPASRHAAPRSQRSNTTSSASSQTCTAAPPPGGSIAARLCLTCCVLFFFCRFLQMASREPPAGRELLTQLVGQRRSEDQGSLWRNLRLDWVRNWDRSCQAAIVLSRLQHSGASDGPPGSTHGPGGVASVLTWLLVSS